MAKISLQTLMNWLLANGYIPTDKYCYRVITTGWAYASSDILQLSIIDKSGSATNYELQMSGVVIEFLGRAVSYNDGCFRLRIHSAPAESFTATSGYTKFPLDHIAEYTCNGSSYAPVWKILANQDDTVHSANYIKDFKDANNISVSYGSAGLTAATWFCVWNGYSIRAMNGEHMNKNMGQGYGTCETAAATAAKTVTLSNYALVTGGIVTVKFTNTNTAANPTLNINSKGAKAIQYNGSATFTAGILSGAVTFIYDGTAYQIISYNNMGASYLPLSGGTVTGSLILSKTQDLSGTADNSPALIVGTKTGEHLEFDGNEIHAKMSGTTVGTLYINGEGGSVSMGAVDKRMIYYTDGNLYLNSSGLSSGGSINGTGYGLIGTNINNYGIRLHLTASVAKHGYVQGNVATYFNMAGASSASDAGDYRKRGWIFYSSTGSLPAASISGDGNGAFTGGVAIGANTTNTTGCYIGYDATTKSTYFSFK